MKLAFLFLCLLLPKLGFSARNNLTINEEDLELERQLKLLNKPAIKTIVENGDIFDCVDIYKQPAFDHPSLKDHKLQLRPRAYPEGLFDNISSSSSSRRTKTINIGLKNGGCPKGTVPIKRVTKDDLLRMKTSSLKHYSSSKVQDVNNVHQTWAIYHTPYASDEKERHQYFGGAALINIYALPQLTSTQFSSSLIWVVNDESNYQNNQIAVGWTVSPQVYGDKNTRLLTSWTADNYEKTGCFDMRCPGFVQVSQIVTLGGAYNPVSTYNGTQRSIEIYIFRDPMTLNWWFAYGKNRTLVGYWPSKIFTGLSDHASRLDFGGTVGNFQSNDMPPMGSGHLPSEGLGKACHFIKVRHLNSDNQFIDLPADDVLPKLTSSTCCYDLGQYNQTGTNYANMFYFGGPGGFRNC